jgi:hypothetical protein
MNAPEQQLQVFGAMSGLPSVSVRAAVRRAAGQLEFSLTIAGTGFLMPELDGTGPDRQDGLWRRTCAELFFGVPGQSGYHEWNLSPSGHWNLYRFDGYRAGGRVEAAINGAAPRVIRAGGALTLRAGLSLRPLGLTVLPLEVGISAVVEATDGSLSHWALAHPAVRPDFHDRRGFVLRLGVDVSSPSPAPSAAIERDQP